MTTTINPMDVYISGVKVFPDVDLTIINSPINGSPALTYMANTANTILTSHYANLEAHKDEYHGFPVIMPIINDNDDSAFHNNGDDYNNYWDFRNANVLDIPFTLCANWLNNSQISTGLWDNGNIFNGFAGLSLSFKDKMGARTINYTSDAESATSGAVHAGDPCFTNNNCIFMFNDCKNLTSLTGLDISNTATFDTTYNLQSEWIDDGWKGEGVFGGYKAMFMGCDHLATLNITWPETLYGWTFDRMFHGCSNLPDNQVPTLDLRPTGMTYANAEFGPTNDTINLEEFMHGCTLMTSTHITNDTWAYVDVAKHAWSGTQIKSIDIPATAVKLINVNSIIDNPRDNEGDYSACKYIIRTTAPMDEYLINGNADALRLFDFGAFNDDANFISTFGGLYVPDAQLSDWKNVITYAFGAGNVANACVHGVSEL